MSVAAGFEPAHAFGPGAMDTRELAVNAAHDAHGHGASPRVSLDYDSALGKVLAVRC